MKLITFQQESPQLGLITDQDKVIPLQQAHVLMTGETANGFQSMLDLIRTGEEGFALAKKVADYVHSQNPPNLLLNLSELNLLAPLPQPESIRDCSSFEDHMINCIRNVGLKKLAKFDSWIEKKFGRNRSFAYAINKPWYNHPTYYKGNRFSVIGTNAPVHKPTFANFLDYELEWAIVIGKKGSNIPSSKAHEYIAGYMLFNDFSAREKQLQEQKVRLGPAKGKDFDTGN
jgi:hypothetical protein